MINIIKKRPIDWDDTAVFEGGKLVRFKSASSGNNWKLQPIPCDDKTISDARDTKASLDEILRPASKHEFMALFKALTLHYYQSPRTIEEIKVMVRDYYEDIGHYPCSLLTEVCAALRKDPTQKFMPKSGDFISKLTTPFGKIKKLERRVNKILGIEEQPKLSLIQQLNKLI